MISLYHRVVIVANRRRVQQCHAAAAALLWVMGRREAGLLVIMRRLHLRYAVTRGLVCATKSSSRRGSRSPYIVRFVRYYKTVCYTFDTVTALA